MNQILETKPQVDPSATIDPTAHIDPSAEIGPGVTIGAHAIVGPSCVIGSGSTLLHHAVVVEGTTMGEGNVVHPFAVIGSDPQDRSYREEDRGELIIGDRNIIREFVTIGRGNWNGPPTRIGSNCYLMNQAHVGHNAKVGDGVIMSNGASLAGHSSVGAGCVMSGFSAVHQFTNVGRNVMFQAHSGVSMHTPPFVVVAQGNTVVGLNIVGIRRHPDVEPGDAEELKRLYRAFYRERGTTPIPVIYEGLSRESWGWAAREFLEFVRESMNHEPPRRCGIVGSRARPGRGKRPR